MESWVIYVCYTCKRKGDNQTLICNAGCSKHFNCISCYENIEKKLKKSEIDCSECKLFYHPKSSLIRNIGNFFGRGSCTYCNKTDNSSPTCLYHSSCMECAHESLLKFCNKELSNCYYCIKSAFFYCKCCFGFVKNSEKYWTSTCQKHFFCKVCIIKKREAIAAFCSFCSPDEFTECAVCDKVFNVSLCRRSHDYHYFCEGCYSKCLISTDSIDKISCEPCKSQITIEYKNYNMPPSMQNPNSFSQPASFIPATISSMPMYESMYSAPNFNNTSVYSQQDLAQSSYRTNTTAPRSIPVGVQPQNYASMTITTPINPLMTNNSTYYQPTTIIPAQSYQIYSCDHRRGMNQARSNFERDFEDLIIQMWHKNLNILNSGKYSLSCPQCQTRNCYKFQMFKSNAQSVCQKYNFDDNFIQFYGQIFEGKNIRFTECYYCKTCTGYFENNSLCYWCRSPLAS